MKIGAAFPSNYIKCEDLQGRSVQVKMNYVKFEDIGGDNKPVLYFIGKDKGMVLNKTNANMIAELYGDETDGWSTQVIELYPTKTDFQGKRVDAIRVRAPSSKNGSQAAPDRIIPNAANRAPAQPRYEDEAHPLPADHFEDSEIPF